MKQCLSLLLTGMLLLVFSNTLLLASEKEEKKAAPDPPKQVAKKNKVEPVLEKALHYLGYLNFSDRTIDRPRSGMTEFEQYKGKLIRTVTIKVIKPFGTTLDEPDKYEANRVQRFTNHLQVNTRQWVVANELLFHEGDTLLPVLVAESERNLWNGSYFKDVRVIVKPSLSDTIGVDITVYVRDRFSWSPSFVARYNDIEMGGEFKNLFGIPQSIEFYTGPKYRKDDPYTVFARYKYNNIAHTHIDVNVSFSYETLEKGATLRLAKPFFSPFNRWGWGFSSSYYKQDATLPSAFADAIGTHVVYHAHDAWVAHSTPLSPRNEKFDLRRIVAAWRVNSIQYLSRPFLHNDDYSLRFPSSWYVMGAIGIANWDYYLDKSIFSSGDAEYFTKGLNYAFTYGIHHDEQIGNRFCTGLKANYGKYFNKFGYWLSQFSTQGFMNGGAWEDVTLSIKNNFYSAPVKMRKFYVRHFLSSKIGFGFLQTPGHLPIINDASGDLRGYYNNTLQGQRTCTFSYQVNVYPPFKVGGFTSCVFAFADLAWVSQQTWGPSQFAQSVGFGLRVRQLGLGIDFFEISFAYLPTRLPAQKSYSIIPDTHLRHDIPRSDLFTEGIVSP